MKSIIASTALLALASTSAMAADSIQIPLSGVLPKSCDVSAYINGPFDALDMTSTEKQGSESLSPVCNYGGTLTVTFSSANNGALVSGSNTVPYTFSVSGGLLNNAALSSPAVVGNWPAVANGAQTRSMSVTLVSAATVAGTYTDTITATVTPN
uniref:hypothetical protein n=1 Tax=Microbulbifer agarilyticus TaxID=260552 RepID=UPI000255AA5C|nr:hypothetical protein [Microbulbifer agarilyticus]